MIEHTTLRGQQIEPRISLAGARSFEQSDLLRQALRLALIVLGITFLTAILFLYVLPTSQMNEARAEILDLQLRKAALARQNAQLAREISYYTDLATLEQRARALGMGPPQHAVFLYADRSDVRPQARPSVAQPSAPSGRHVLVLDRLPHWDDLASWVERSGAWLADRLEDLLNVLPISMPDSGPSG